MSDLIGIDPQGLVRLESLGGPDFVREMIDLFLQEAPERLAAARDGAQAGDWEAVADATHSLKSSSHNFGATHLAFLAEKIEMTARFNKGENIPDLLRDLDQDFRTVKAWLESQRDSLKQ